MGDERRNRNSCTISRKRTGVIGRNRDREEENRVEMGKKWEKMKN